MADSQRPVSLTYTLKQVEQVLASFAPDLLGAEFRAGSHDLPAAGSSWGDFFFFCWVRQLGSFNSSGRFLVLLVAGDAKVWLEDPGSGR
jgi:hypothetical protein